MKLYFKQLMLTAGMMILGFLILGLSFVSVSYNQMLGEKRKNIYANAYAIADAAASFGLTSDPTQSWWFKINIVTTGRATGTNTFVCDLRGRVVACSDDAIICEHIGREISGEILNVIRETKKYEVTGTLDEYYGGNMYVVGVPVTAKFITSSLEMVEMTLGYVFVAESTETMTAIWETFSSSFIVIALIVLFAAVVITSFAAVRQVKPLREMADAAHKFAYGDFSVRVENTGREDEIGDLTLAFNAMAESLEKSEQLRREFVANVSHELKTPMTTISGFVNGILDGTISQDRQREYLEIIALETGRLARLVSQMMEASRLQTVEYEAQKIVKFNISELLCRTLLSLEQKINDKKLDIEARLPEEPIITVGSEDGITQVVYNLLDNAIKYSHEGGTVTLSLWKKGDKAYVSMVNQGETIPRDELPMVFDRFHKIDRSRGMDREGVGLGLYIVKTILEQHEEDVTVTSEAGTTEFVFKLKLYKE